MKVVRFASNMSVLCLGYKGEIIVERFMDSDLFMLTYGDGQVF